MQERKKVRVGRSLSAVPREDAGIEAEKGETILTNLSEDGIPEFYKIDGKPHSQGGTPLTKELTEGTFIFSKDKSMKIKDPEVLKQFGYKNPKKSGYTPAEISMKFDNSKAREVLVDDMADKISIEAAEKMIANYNEKHGLLAFIQESQKGFPTGLPQVATPYLNASGIDIEELTMAIEGSKNQQGEPQAPQGEMPIAQKGYSLEDKKRFDKLIYDYTAQNNKAGMNFKFNDKEIDLNSGKYNQVMNPIKLKGKDFDRVYFDNKRLNADSINEIPNVPTDYAQAFWPESGNFVPVGSGAQDYADKYIKTYQKGKHGSQRYVTNVWDEEAKYEEPLPTKQLGGSDIIDYDSELASDSTFITPGTQNVNDIDLKSRDTSLVRQYDWSEGYEPSYDTKKNISKNDTLNPRKKELNTQLNDLRRKMASVYNVPTTKDGMPDYTQMDVNQVFDKSLMDESDLNSLYDILNEKRAIRDAQGFQRKQFYGDKEAEQRGFNRDTALEDLDLGIRFMTGVQNNELFKAQDGAEVTRKRKTKAPKGSVVWDTSLDDFNPNDVMNGDYVVIDGVVKKVDNLRKKELQGSDYVDERLGDMQSVYGSLKNKLKDKKVREKIYDKYLEKVKSAKRLSKADKSRLISLSEDDVIKSFLKQQEQVAIIGNRNGLRDKDGKLLPDVSEWDKGEGSEKNKKYKEFVNKNNIEELTEDEIKVSQGVFQALDALRDDPLLSDVRVRPTGKKDSAYDENSRISEIEGFAGNTLMGQAAGVVAPNEYDTLDLDYEEEKVKEEPQNLTQVAAQKKTPFWLQDDVNLIGAIGDRFSLKKQTPLELTGNVSIPNPTFYSPDQAIQNTLSSQKTATEGAKAFGSAADYANFANFTQGKAASQVANNIANVQNQNVGISNDFAARKAQLMNQDSGIKAASKVREWDKYNLVDSNYDNAARASNAEIRKQFNNRWTNRGMTQTLNERDDQFDVDPRTGFTYHTGVEKELDPSKVQADIHQTASNLMANYADMSPSDAFEYAMKLRGIGGSKSKNQPISYPGRKA